MTNKLPVIGFIGNFIPPFSTENDRKWSFEKLGYKVITFQEDLTSVAEIKQAIANKEIDILFYSHTHGWDIPGLIELFEFCKTIGLPTVSVHLDKWAGLERESDVGKEATWFTEYQFMADFSEKAKMLYRRHNLNAFYLPAAVVERDCYMAAPDRALFPHDIIFVGSKGYHKEYPFRPQMIEFLQKEYGDRFAHWGADGLGVVRGELLNTLMASAKIVVGDSCFAGESGYVSDRYYETRGRGGFLVHPNVSGVDHVGIGLYQAGDLQSLKKNIDYFLNNDWEREETQDAGFRYVKEYETYTNRAKKIMEVVYGTDGMGQTL